MTTLIKDNIMSRNKHPIKEIEEAVSYAESKGWTAVDSKGHAKFKVICPFND